MPFFRTTRRSFLAWISLLVLASLPLAGNAGLIQQSWVTDGVVFSITGERDGAFYVGGSFTYVGNYLGNALPFDAVTATADTSFPKVNGSINEIIQDGDGGWFLGGTFTYVDETPRNGLAHVLADGTLDADWDPDLTFSTVGVDTMVVSGGTLYVGGLFTAISGQSRSNIAALDADTGEVLSWNPGANGRVRVLYLNSGTLFVGGDFSTCADQARNGIAALDPSTGTASAWNPNANGRINDVVRSTTSTVYLGGTFTTIGGATRNRLAEVSLSSASATAWDPNLNNFVNRIIVATSTIYVGGNFTTIGGATRNRLAEIDIVSASATTWNPNSNGSVDDMLMTTSSVFVGGEISTIGGGTSVGLSEIRRDTGLLTSWAPSIRRGGTGNVMALVFDGTSIYAGGIQWAYNPQSRNRLAAIDASTGEVTSWNPNVNGAVAELRLSNTTSTLYVGGSFTTIGGATRNRLAEVSLSSASPTSWHPNLVGNVEALELSTSTIFVGGSFTSVSGDARNRLAEIGLTSASATAWNPNVNSTVSDIRLSTSTLFIGGAFTTVGGATRNRLAEISLSSASATSWDPNSSAGIFAVAVSSSNIYAAGTFSTLGGISRSLVGRIDDAGVIVNWNPNINTSLSSSGRAFAFMDHSVLVSASTGFSRLNTPLLQFSTSSASGSEGDVSPLTLELTEAVSDPVVVNLTISGTATNGTDYSLSTSVTLSPGTTSVSIPTSITEDSRIETDETVIVGFSIASPSYVNPGSVTTTTYTILNDDTAVESSSGGGGLGAPEAASIPPPITYFQSTAPVVQAANISAHTLLKLPDDRNALTQSDSAVYYVGTDGKRHAFPSDKVFFSWYLNFAAVQIVGADQLASIPLGKNIGYRPGTRLVKFMTSPKVYVVAPGGVLRWIVSESLAADLFGREWNRSVDDISETFYGDYQFGEQINEAYDYARNTESSTLMFPSDDF